MMATTIISCLTLVYILLPITIKAATIAHNHSFTFSIASYNLENLWDNDVSNTPQISLNTPASLLSKYQNLQYDSFSERYSNWHNQAIITAKLINFLKVISLADNPDILALQELESADNKSKVFDLPINTSTTLRQALKQRGYQYFLLGQQDVSNPVSVTTGIISKLPIIALQPVKIDFTPASPSARDIQVVEVILGHDRLVIFNNHWKSKRNGGHNLRNLTAQKLRQRILAERQRPNTHIVVLGDFNATHYEQPLALLGSTADERRMVTRRTSTLYNLWYELKPFERWDHSYNGQRDTLSHILVSDSLYYSSGLQYINQSFKVIGHSGPSAQILLGADGVPLRWQVQSYKTYSHHIGIGFSDHLPLVAQFKYIPWTKATRRTKLTNINPKYAIIKEPKIPLLDKVKVCQPTAIKPWNKLNWNQPQQLIGKCIKIAVPEGLPLLTRGRHHSTYVKLPLPHKKQTFSLGITMTRSYDWRPNINDPDVSISRVILAHHCYSPYKPHPLSNRCYQRTVLQGKGGKLVFAMGRLGYKDGFFSIHIISRHSKYLVLKDLPPHKQQACQLSNN